MDDHGAVREATESVLRSIGFEVTEGTGDVATACALVRNLRPTVVVLDVRLGVQSGVRLARLLKAEHPGLRLVAFTAVDDPAELRELLEVPVHGLVRKSGSVDELVAAIDTVAAGGRHVAPGLERELGLAPVRRLSVREREILHMLADGLTAEAIALQLSLAPATVRTHVRNAVAHMGAKSRTHAVALALRAGELDGEPRRR